MYVRTAACEKMCLLKEIILSVGLAVNIVLI